MSFTYSGPFVAPTLTVGILNDCWNLATAKSTDLDNKINAALSTLGAAPTMAAAVATPIPTILEPTIDIPTTAKGPDLTLFTSYNNEIIDKLVLLFTNYISTYFPADDATNAAVELMLQNILAGGTGVDPTIEAQLWERDRSRILSDKVRALDAAANIWAARRFPIPPGALQYQSLQIEQKTQDELAKSSREIAIKMYEVEIEQIKFAVTNGIKLREVAMSTAGDYIKALASSLTTAQALALSQSEAQNHLIQATAAFLNARSNAAEVVFKARATNAGFQQEANKSNQVVSADLMKEQGRLTAAAAEAIAREAAALFNNLHTSVGVSGSETMA